MTYIPKSGIFARTNESAVTMPSNTVRTIELNNSVVDGSSFDGTNLSSNSNNILVQCDVRFTYSGTYASYFQCYWTNGAAEDRARQVPPGAQASLFARDEFWGLGNSIRPIANGVYYTNASIAINDCLVIGLVI